MPIKRVELITCPICGRLYDRLDLLRGQRTNGMCPRCCMEALNQRYGFSNTEKLFRVNDPIFETYFKGEWIVEDKRADEEIELVEEDSPIESRWDILDI